MTSPTPGATGDHTFSLLRLRLRVLPACALLLATNDDRVQSSLRPFLTKPGRVPAKRLDLQLRVEGHADARSCDATSDDLALRRATRVAEAIRAHGPRPTARGARLQQIVV
jgi:flagellar motor protein MotB